jgi:hypothetical protein
MAKRSGTSLLLDGRAAFSPSLSEAHRGFHEGVQIIPARLPSTESSRRG